MLADTSAPMAPIRGKVLTASFPEQNLNDVRVDNYFWLQDVTRRAAATAVSWSQTLRTHVSLQIEHRNRSSGLLRSAQPHAASCKCLTHISIGDGPLIDADYHRFHDKRRDALRLNLAMLLSRRMNPQVLDYLNAENNYTAAVLAPMANLTAELYAEMAGRIPASDVSDPPQRYKGFYYYEYRVPGGQFMVKARCACGRCLPMQGVWRHCLQGRCSGRHSAVAV